ncbi:MAG: RDD family protein [Desulfuromusa sp.]
MQITCPHCGFSKEINQEQLPADASRVNCPKCKQSFPLHAQIPETEFQPKTTEKARQTSTYRSQISANAEVDALPKAGFWMRVVATFIDAFIVFVLQFLLGSLLALAGFAAVSGKGTPGNIAILVQLFGFALSFAYYVFFTGYCGQTPGKMALRIKVIRCDGSQLSYGRAAFREIPAKFISGIIFGIGYLMVAFDDQKQGLHDRMANTYVIKL